MPTFPRSVRWPTWPLLIGALLVPACQSGGPATPQPEGETAAQPSPAEPAGGVVAAGSAPLERAVGLTFGLPLPVGLELIERDEDVAHFRSPHSLEALVAFYDRELPQHRRIEAADGTMYERDAEGATGVYLIAGAEGREVVYVQGPADLAALGLTSAAVAGEAPPREERPRGVVAPPEVVQRIRAEQAPRSRAGGGAFYDERFEEVEGEPVRVLTLREQPSDSLLNSQPQPEPWDGHSAALPRRPGGSYDRGDGHRSLRSRPERDAEGNPLPFVGSQRLDLDPNDFPH